jgi:hypothetical protein
MAICDACGQEMLDLVGCNVTSITFEDGCYERIRYGDEPDDWGARRGHPCGDCGVPPGSFHHPGCDIEACPSCGDQQLSCWCGDRVWEDETRQKA